MNTSKIGAFLQSLRRDCGLTQEQLGERLGVTGKTISRWGAFAPFLGQPGACTPMNVSRRVWGRSATRGKQLLVLPRFTMDGMDMSSHHVIRFSRRQ